MKHEIKELFKVHNIGDGQINIATKDFLEKNSIVIAEGRYAQMYDKHGEIYATSLISRANSGKPLKVHSANGIKLIYLFGEKTWFDTQEELNKYREDFQKEQAFIHEHNKLKKAINEKLNEMTIEELKQILEQM